MCKKVILILFILYSVSFIFSDTTTTFKKDILSTHLDMGAYDVFTKLHHDTEPNIEEEMEYIWKNMHALYLNGNYGGFLHSFVFLYKDLSLDPLLKKYYNAINIQQKSNTETFKVEELPWWLWKVNFSFLGLILAILLFFLLFLFWGILQIHAIYFFSWFPEKGFFKWLHKKEKVLFKLFYVALSLCIIIFSGVLTLKYLDLKKDYRVIISKKPVPLLVDLELSEEKASLLEPGTIILQESTIGLWSEILLISGQKGFVRRSLLSGRLDQDPLKIER